MAQSKLYHEALARFKKDAEAVYQDSKDRAILYDFLKEKGTPEDAKKAAEGLQIEAGSKYGSRKVGDTKIPQEWISNILDNIGNFIQLGDYATTGAPESVGLAWYAIRLTLSAIQNNYELYNFFGAGLSNISEIMIIIPHYDRLYDERDRRGWKPSPVVDKLFKDIIETYAAVLDFSLSIKRHLNGGVMDKIRHGIKDFFNLQKGKFEGKLAAIAMLKKKILEGCKAAFQERSLEGLDGMKDVMSGVRATVDGIRAFQPTLQRFHDEQLAKIDELQKYFAKFDEKLDGFEDNIKAWAKPKTPWELAVQEFDKINTKLKPMNDTRGAFRALAERRFPGTCEWVFDEGIYDPYYQWHQCQTGNLYCFTGREGIHIQGV
ncbi:hypothetical protein K469DRAFT_168171 [Zopfia rhizophila CBS 207.26]|uniref:NWD NACHT-NTPase N-terminal domain-containing protein n=1 Tax=Zopfia rhizophila CBS 207.26 TaxID=1314779 RepID=A0A6A6DZ77_9PEZI|nr:hypothetical protein K469DRAFT_168171 [Zopfia rhizophila CBS 207.26]